MAITPYGTILHPSPALPVVIMPFIQFTLNASGDRIGFIIEVPKDGTLDWFEMRLATVTNNPDNGVRFSFQDIALATGFPDGTQDQFADLTSALSSNTWIAPPSVMTHDGTPGGTKRTVSAGDLLGCVLDFVSFTAGDQISVFSINDANRINNFYTADGSGGSYVKSNTIPLLALKYSDGTYAEFPFPLIPVLGSGSTLSTTNTYNSGSTPDEYALRFQVPIKSRIVGMWAQIDIDAALDVILYDSASNILESRSLDPDVRASVNLTVTYVYFDTPIEVDANTTYRLSILPTSGSNVTLISWIFGTGTQGAAQGGSQFYLSTRTNAGAWSDSTSQRPVMGLIIDGFETGAAGGGEHSAVF